jgi:hypothetical protein
MVYFLTNANTWLINATVSNAMISSIVYDTIRYGLFLTNAEMFIVKGVRNTCTSNYNNSSMRMRLLYRSYGLFLTNANTWSYSTVFLNMNISELIKYNGLVIKCYYTVTEIEKILFLWFQSFHCFMICYCAFKYSAAFFYLVFS